MDTEASSATSNGLFTGSLVEGPVPRVTGDLNDLNQRLGVHKTSSLVESKQVGTKRASDEVEIIKRRLIIDGEGDEKKLTKLTENYIRFLSSIDGDITVEELQNRADTFAIYEAFKSLLEQTDGLRTNVGKTYHAIVTNTKASLYWTAINSDIGKEMAEMKALVLGLRQQAADVQRNRKECQEREALVKILAHTQERKKGEEELGKLQEEHKELLIRKSELDNQIKAKKTFLDYLVSVVKRLDNDQPAVVKNAVKEVEEKVLSDVSMDLE